MLAAAQAPSISPSASLDYSVFKKAVLNACKVIDKGNTIPVLDTLLITSVRGGCHVFGTDLDLCTTTFVPGQSHPDFVAVIDAHKLKGVMDKVTAAPHISFEMRDDEKLLVTIGKVNLTLKQDIPQSDFPDEAFKRQLCPPLFHVGDHPAESSVCHID